MRRVVLIVVMGILMAGAAAAEDMRKIIMSGQGMVETVPDMAVISFAVESTGAELPPIKKENDRIAKKAVEALRKAGIPRADLHTTRYNISRHYDAPVKNEKRERVYTVRNQMKVTVRNAEKAGEIIGILEDAGVNTIQGINYTTSKSEELKLEALEAAYRDAKRKAEHLAKLEGYRVEVLNISNTGYTPRPEVYMAADAVMAKNGAAVYNPTEVSVNASVNAEFKMIK